MTASGNDHDKRPLTDKELDRVLATACETLERRIEAKTNFSVLLASLLDAVSDPAMAEPAPFMVRLWLRQVRAALYRADVLAGLLMGVFPAPGRAKEAADAVSAAFVNVKADDPSTAPDLVRLLNIAVARVLGLAISHTTTSDVLLEGYLTSLTRTLIKTLAHALGKASDIAMQLPHLHALGDAAAMDLRGIDLTKQPVGSIDVLFDFIWDDETIWPPPTGKWARLYSVNYGDGAYQIQSPDGLPRHPAVLASCSAAKLLGARWGSDANIILEKSLDATLVPGLAGGNVST